MYFPFSLKSASNWLDLVPKFLLVLPDESIYLQNKEFHQYLASSLETFFPEASTEFLNRISTILTDGTEAGKYVLLEILLLAESIWETLAQDIAVQPILTGLALSTERIYSKNAAILSRKLEDIHTSKDEKEIAEVLYESKDEAFADEALLDDILEGALEEISSEKRREKASPELKDFMAITRDEIAPAEAAQIPTPPFAQPAPKGIKRADTGLPGGAPPSPSHAATRSAPPASQPVPPPPLAAKPAPPTPNLAPIIKTDTFENHKKRKASIEEKAQKEEPEEELSSIPTETFHTHAHYYARMNSRKTYPLTITLSRIAKKIAADKSHFLSGEKEKETRGKFEVTESIKRLIIEPLLSGCLVQPTSQFVDPRPQNLPKVLTFFITPLVTAGFRATPLNGSILVKNEVETVLLKLNLPELSVASHRFSKVAALAGTIGGGAMPAFDFLFGVNLQVTLARQLATINPQLDQSFNLLWIVMGAQLLLFIGAIGLAFLWWWKKGRAKLAPDRASSLHLPQ